MSAILIMFCLLVVDLRWIILAVLLYKTTDMPVWAASIVAVVGICNNIYDSNK